MINQLYSKKKKKPLTMWFCQFLPSVWLVSEEGRGRGRVIPPEPCSSTSNKKLVPCDNLEASGGEEDGREDQERRDILYLWLLHADTWQKPTQYWKAIILQLRLNTFKVSKVPGQLEIYLATSPTVVFISGIHSLKSVPRRPLHLFPLEYCHSLLLSFS